MTTIAKLSDFISGATFDTLPQETTDHVKLHILDTVGAMLVGAQTLEGVAIGRLVAKFAIQGNIPVIGYSIRTALLPAIIAGCSATRCTEIDDIHLESCTTPGSVIAPTALSLVSAGYLIDPRDFLVAVVLGYELLIRFGIAINGPEVLYRGVWPTYLAAALGSATVTARALKLSSQHTASALATALTMSTGITSRVRSALSSRTLTLGIAAQNGVIAALSAQEEFAGDETLLDKKFGHFHSLIVSHEKLLNNLGQGFYIDQTGIKPYPTARQALSAVEAFREIMATNRINPESIQEVSVWVPGQFIAIIDHPDLPGNRRESVSSVQYQIALAACEPNRLLDVKRERLVKDECIRALIEKIHVKPSEELERDYPSVWPARVQIQADGRTYSGEMLHPKGDQHNKFSWDDVTSKFRWVVKPALNEVETEQVADLVRNLDASANLTNLLKLLT